MSHENARGRTVTVSMYYLKQKTETRWTTKRDIELRIETTSNKKRNWEPSEAVYLTGSASPTRGVTLAKPQ